MRLFNDGWEFRKQKIGTGLKEMKERDSEFVQVGIPHDWLIGQTENLYEDSTGWYRKKFFWKKAERNRVFLRFDGIYMDCHIFVNGAEAGEWKYGYTTFEIEITEYLRNEENEIWISVNYQTPNSRWYTGAGIYRNIWIREVSDTCIMADGIYFSAKRRNEKLWNIEIETELEVKDQQSQDLLSITYTLREKGNETSEIFLGKQYVTGTDQTKQTVLFLTELEEPIIWDTENPQCYELQTVLYRNQEILQKECQTVGFRTIELLPDKGLLLNGRKLKLNGVCEHHDLGCLGAAFHKKAMERKFRILKQMGVNAVRLAHNMSAPEVMELADEMGILIVTEAFDMWTSSKTPHDYGRFFKEWYQRDIANWVKRDRNHPCLLMWSIGNEIYDTHVDENGQYWCRVLMDEVRKYDRKENAQITLASNYLPWENARKCADIVKNVGYNYGEKYYDAHHKEHPDWVIYGSETGSVVQSRGIYHFPYQQSVLTDEDEQCSSLGNSTTSWGAASAEACIKAEIEHPYSCGQFVWSGFDFIGEPTPYHTRSSYFGQIDTAGFPKDSFYIYKSGWTDYRKDPMVHIFPYWDFNEQQMIDVRVCSNAPVIELFLNGKSQGTCTLNQEKGTILAGLWQIPYEEGELCAVACDENGTVLAKDMQHSFGEAAEFCLTTSEEELKADGEDLLFVEVSMKDAQGFPVVNANNRIQIEVSGAGALVGTDNGDSTDTDEYKSGNRRLFSGKLLLVCKAGTSSGTMVIRLRSQGIPEKILTVPVKKAEIRQGISESAYLPEKNYPDIGAENDNIQVRNIRLISSNGLHLHKENPTTVVTAKLCPSQASDQEVFWNIVDDAGIPLKIATIESDGLQARVTAVSDGSFRVRCMSKSGTDHVRIISTLEFTVSEFGKAFTDPYEFVSAGLYDYGKGEIGNGNEHGVATARDGESQVGFKNIDFGSYGSDEITVPIFALTDDPYEIQIYEGMPEEDGILIGSFIYQKPKMWNVYQEETFHLKKRLKGVTGICFVLHEKIHIKGFWFKKYNRAWQKLSAGECDKIYGDSFTKDGDHILGIGNNVTIVFENMDFGKTGTNCLRVSGNTPLEKNTIILKFAGESQEEQRMIEFSGGKEEQNFTIEPVSGYRKVSMVFLPGSNFDFYDIQFNQTRQ